MEHEPSLYEILGVSPSASPDKVKLAYRAAVRKHHPDVNHAPDAQALTETLNLTYAVLSDPANRRLYDEALQVGMSYSADPAEAETTPSPGAPQAGATSSAGTAQVGATASAGAAEARTAHSTGADEAEPAHFAAAAQTETAHSAGPTDAGTSSSAGSTEPSAGFRDLLTCDDCDQVHPQLRFANFFNVWSILVYTRMRTSGGILCPECRSRRAAASALFSGFFGAWGLPFGLFHTVRALLAAARGGEFPCAENTQLLQHQGFAFLERGRVNEAATNFADSLKFENSPKVATLLKDTQFSNAIRLNKIEWLSGQAVGVFSFAIPVMIVILCLATTVGRPTVNSTSVADVQQPVAEVQHSTTPARAASQLAPALGRTDTPTQTQTQTMPATEWSASALEQVCLQSSETEARNAMDVACQAFRMYVADSRARSANQSDRGDNSVLAAIADYALSVAANRSGEPNQELHRAAAEAVGSLDDARTSHMNREIKAMAERFFDCSQTDQCVSSVP